MSAAPLLIGRAAPHPALRPFVRALHAYAETVPGPELRRELPTAHAVLIVNLGAPLWICTRGRWERFPDGLLAGLDDASVLSSTRGALQEGVQVLLTPLGCRRLAGVAMHELTARSVALEDVLGPDARRLADRLRELRSWRARVDVVQAFLARRLLDGPDAPPDVAWAWTRLERSGGLVRVGDLAAELGCSTRHLGARFRDHVGLAPKRAARLLRFERAIGLLEAGEPAARVAADTGFADQAHLSREVRAMTGLPPRALLLERRSGSYKSEPLDLA
ncbi:MAG TPA: helix-turn-helix domain-containing protein [Baekduia sp.]|nr:helix-turn-helix domain-containing protein [Baekduia sp.]